MIKRTEKYLLILLGVLTLSLIFVSAKAHAAPSQKVIIKELMWMGSSKSTSDEWLVLYNTTSKTIDLSNWQLIYWSQNFADDEKMLQIPEGKLIHPNDYFLISNYDLGDSHTVLNIKPDLVDTSVQLSNTNLQIKLYDSDALLIDIAGDTDKPLAGQNSTNLKAAMERNDEPGDGTILENWHTAQNQENLIDGVTDLALPQNFHDLAPSPSNLIIPENNAQIIQGKDIQFAWEKSLDPESDPLTYTLSISCLNNSFSISEIFDNFYSLNTDEILENLGNCSNLKWQIFVSDGTKTTSSNQWQFEVIAPSYCDEIILTEMMPNPNGDQAINEWFELYNPSNAEVNLKDWSIEDLKGSTHKYLIKNDLIIAPNNYLVVFRSQSGITLNDSEDGLTLYQPDGHLLYQSPNFSAAGNDLSWARAPDGKWQWSSTPTPGAKNKITALEATSDLDDDSQKPDISINSVPIEIATGDYKNYQNQLVKITGTVTDTSGNTFYLDDGSGEVKIYIQAKTNIDKPAMHKGDTFQIIGVVDLYSDSNWRILPRVQDDVRFINGVSKTTAKKAASKKTTKKAATTLASSKKVLATDNSQDGNSDKAETNKVPFWLEIMESLIGLAVIALIWFYFVLKRRAKDKVIGGHFGDDFT